MRNDTRRLFNAYAAQLAVLNGVDDATQSFTTAPSVQQTLEDRIQESSDFLSQVNSTPVPEMLGDKIGLGIGSPIASRTNTATTDRAPIDPSTLDDTGYQLFQTNFDTFLKYAKLDMWAKFPDFQERIRNAILRRCALDRILIGWNGTTAAAATDRAAHPNLSDVNKGWIQHLREDKPAHLMSSGATNGTIKIGGAGDYATLDALVWDLKESALPSWAVADTELVAICGRDLLHDKYFPLINADRDPTEQVARDVIMSTKRLGGLPAATVPGFPAGAVTVTRFDNLSVYWQEGKRRRTIVDNAKRDQIENYESSNEAYVVEDYDYMCHAENITIL